MKQSLSLFTATILCLSSALFAQNYESETKEKYSYTSQAHWQCPNKKKYDSEDAARKACGSKAHLVDEQGTEIPFF